MPDAYLPRFLSREGLVLPGVKRAIAVPNPAAGNDWSLTVPGGRQWRVLCAIGNLQTSAVVASRAAGWGITVDGVLVFKGAVPTTFPAGNPGHITYGIGAVEQAAPVAGYPASVAIPDVRLPPGAITGPLTINLNAGDQWSGVGVLIEEVYLDDQELTKLHEEKLQALGVEQEPWGPPIRTGA